MSTEKNLFEIAARGRFRFPFKGSISVEDLWVLPVKDLDSIFKTLNGELKQVKEESLLQTKTQQNEELEVKIEIVKYIVKTMLEEEQARVNAKKKKEERQKILELMDSKRDEERKSKSMEELQKMLNELDN